MKVRAKKIASTGDLILESVAAERAVIRQALRYGEASDQCKNGEISRTELLMIETRLLATAKTLYSSQQKRAKRLA